MKVGLEEWEVIFNSISWSSSWSNLDNSTKLNTLTYINIDPLGSVINEDVMVKREEYPFP